jgi:hypothetical protein
LPGLLLVTKKLIGPAAGVLAQEARIALAATSVKVKAERFIDRFSCWVVNGLTREIEAIGELNPCD